MPEQWYQLDRPDRQTIRRCVYIGYCRALEDGTSIIDTIMDELEKELDLQPNTTRGRAAAAQPGP